jgi:hypothetical protein
MIDVYFSGQKQGDPNTLRLDYVPRAGDEITLDQGLTYDVVSVRWQLTTKNLREVNVTLAVKTPNVHGGA